MACWLRNILRLVAIAPLFAAMSNEPVTAADAWPDRYNDCLAVEEAETGIDACVDALTSPALSVFERAAVYTRLARFYRKADLIAEADASVKFSLSLDPGNPESYAELGAIQYVKMELEGAYDPLTRAISDGISSAHVYNNRGMVLQALGELDNAIADLDLAVELSTSNGEIWNNRANLFCEAGNAEASYQDRIQALYNLRFTAAAAQAGLRKSGFYEGPTDGIWGYDSEQALRAWTRAGCPNAPASRLQ